jgi:hypothetical protein
VVLRATAAGNLVRLSLVLAGRSSPAVGPHKADETEVW